MRCKDDAEVLLTILVEGSNLHAKLEMTGEAPVRDATSFSIQSPFEIFNNVVRGVGRLSAFLSNR